MSQTKSKRPTGITVLGILYILTAIVNFFAFIQITQSSSFNGLAVLSTLFALITMVLFFVISGLLFSGKGRKAVIGLVIGTIVMSVISLFLQSPAGVISVIVNILILVYLRKQHVKEYFDGTSVQSTFSPDPVHSSTDNEEDPLLILKRRFAEGEITKEEFNDIKKDLI